MKSNGFRQLLKTAQEAINIVTEKATTLISNLKVKGEKEYQPTLQLYSLTDKYRNISRDVNRGRKQEIQDIFDILNKREQHNIILKGEFGVGKNSVVEAVAEHIAKKKCPEVFKDKEIVQLYEETLNPSMHSSDEIFARIIALYEYLSQNPNDILYIRDFSLIIRYGLLEEMKLIFEEYFFISTLNYDQCGDDFLEKDTFMLTHFEVIDVDPPEYEEIYDMLSYQLHELSKYHNVRIRRRDIELIMDLEYRKNSMLIPWGVINSFDYVMGICKSHGLHEVTTGAILEQNRYYINRFLNFSIEKKTTIAYHEVGHCIVAIEFGVKLYGLQIIPSNDSLGTNYFDFEEYGYRSKNNYMNYICVMIGGVLSTDRKGLSRIDGISEDIEKASSFIRNMILNYSMIEDEISSYVEKDGIKMIYLSEKMKDKLDIQYRKIMNEATQITKKILEENAENIEILVHALIKKGFLTTKEIEALLEKRLSLDSIPDMQDLIFK